jgi:flagellar hook protein FlgE
MNACPMLEVACIVSTDPLFIGISGLEAAATQIDVSANNVANVGTSGFQAQDVGFEDIYAGAVAARISTNQAPGGLDPTGGATNLAISGAGFFVLGGGASTTYTRDGNFIAGGNGVLVDASSGLTVTGVNGGPIAIPPGTTGLAVAPDGTVTGALAGQTATFGRIALAAFQNPSGLARVGGGYQASADAGNVLLGAPGSAGYGTLAPGFLESSNVDLTSEFVKMIAAQTAFAANAKTVHTADENLKTIVNLDDPE